MGGRELSYVNAGDPPWKRFLMAALEDVSGRRRVLPAYRQWRSCPSPHGIPVWGDLLTLVGTRLDIDAPPEFPQNLPQPLVMIANHPFGIPDGVAMMALAERLGRPFRILIHSDLMRIPEVARVGLPVDFSETRAAVEINLRTRAEARAMLAAGGTLIIFPSGGVATADHPFGKAEELIWKPFVARLVRQIQAHVLPVYFEGQNSPVFHLASRFSVSIRLALIVSEARRKVGRSIRLRIGKPVASSELAARQTGRSLLDELYLEVHRLAPDAAGKKDEDLLPRPAHLRMPFPWEHAEAR